MANLIGRFEKQKATSSTPAAPIIPRTSSVASHLTGDSAIEELREKREWPPKSTSTRAPALVPPPPPLPAVTLPPSDESPDTIPGETPADTPSVPPPPPENIIQYIPPVEITPPTPAAPSHPAPVVVDHSLSMTSPLKPATTVPTTKVTPTKAKVTSDHPSASPRASIVRSSVKSNPVKSVPTPTKSAGTASTSGPVKTPVKSVGTPRNHVSKPLHHTPDRAKSPAEARTRTPSSLTRPKTPSHLYAPTAASLARSKVGAPAPAPVEKPKRKLTTDLTKPTAASAARMRSPAVNTTVTLSRSPKLAVTRSTIKSSTLTSKMASAVKPTVKSPSRPTNTNTAQDSSVIHNSDVTAPIESTSAVVVDEPDGEDTRTQTGDDEVREQHSKEEDEIENYDNDFVDESQDPTSIVNEPERESVDENSSLQVRAFAYLISNITHPFAILT